MPTPLPLDRPTNPGQGTGDGGNPIQLSLCRQVRLQPWLEKTDLVLATPKDPRGRSPTRSWEPRRATAQEGHRSRGGTRPPANTRLLLLAPRAMHNNYRSKDNHINGQTDRHANGQSNKKQQPIQPATTRQEGPKKMPGIRRLPVARKTHSPTSRF